MNKFNGRFNILKRELISKKRGQDRLSTYSKKRQIENIEERVIEDIAKRSNIFNCRFRNKIKERNGAKTIFKMPWLKWQNFPEQTNKT